jgi:hypothetical protein
MYYIQGSIVWRIEYFRCGVNDIVPAIGGWEYMCCCCSGCGGICCCYKSVVKVCFWIRRGRNVWSCEG